ncbi:hypothetical protein Tco_0530459 [Tanacetum coccineum]
MAAGVWGGDDGDDNEGGVMVGCGGEAAGGGGGAWRRVDMGIGNQTPLNTVIKPRQLLLSRTALMAASARPNAPLLAAMQPTKCPFQADVKQKQTPLCVDGGVGSAVVVDVVAATVVVWRRGDDDDEVEMVLV